jgi:hypothetical protein
MQNWRKAAKEWEHLVERIVKVESYAGYKSDERPVCVRLRERAEEVKKYRGPLVLAGRDLLPSGGGKRRPVHPAA